MSSLGKLKKTLKEKCPECRQSNLEIRTTQKRSMIDGEVVFLDNDYIICTKCGYENEIEQKRRFRGEDAYGYSQRGAT